jgi:hypothetical protein
VQIVVNCATRLCSQFLGPGDNFFVKLWCDFYGSGSDRIGQSDGTDEYLVFKRGSAPEGGIFRG